VIYPPAHMGVVSPEMCDVGDGSRCDSCSAPRQRLHAERRIALRAITPLDIRGSSSTRPSNPRGATPGRPARGCEMCWLKHQQIHVLTVRHVRKLRYGPTSSSRSRPSKSSQLLRSHAHHNGRVEGLQHDWMGIGYEAGPHLSCIAVSCSSPCRSRVASNRSFDQPGGSRWRR